MALPKVHRVCSGLYEIGSRHIVEKDEGTNKWIVFRYKKNSEEVEETYDEYDSYADARDQALKEAIVYQLT